MTNIRKIFFLSVLLLAASYITPPTYAMDDDEQDRTFTPLKSTDDFRSPDFQSMRQLTYGPFFDPFYATIGRLSDVQYIVSRIWAENSIICYSTGRIICTYSNGIDQEAWNTLPEEIRECVFKDLIGMGYNITNLSTFLEANPQFTQFVPSAEQSQWKVTKPLVAILFKREEK